MRGLGNVQSPRTKKGTSQPQHNMPCDVLLEGQIPHKHTNPKNNMTYLSLLLKNIICALSDRYGGIAVLYINILKSDLMSAKQTIIII